MLTNTHFCVFLEKMYPDRPTVLSAYIFILVPHGNRNHNPGVASSMLYQLSHAGPCGYQTFCYDVPNEHHHGEPGRGLNGRTSVTHPSLEV